MHMEHDQAANGDGEARVLVVEDDEEIAIVLARTLRLEGYTVEIAEDGKKAIESAELFSPNLVLLDLGLPQIDGIEVCRMIREQSDLPILMLTARDALDDRVAGLDTGADDYMVKPFEREELLARIRALLRRAPPKGSASLTIGDLVLNPARREVTRAANDIELTSREFELLEYMMRNQGLVISRQKLLDEVWQYDPFAITNTVDVFISNLRRKVEIKGMPQLIKTVRGSGYMIKKPSES